MNNEINVKYSITFPETPTWRVMSASFILVIHDSQNFLKTENQLLALDKDFPLGSPAEHYIQLYNQPLVKG